jgi:carboxyl-terminal processing protease
VSRRPFAGLPAAVVCLPNCPPDPFDPISQFCQLLIDERAELEAELGCPVTFDGETASSHSAGPAVCYVGPSAANPALREALAATGRPLPGGSVVWIDRERLIVGIDGPSLTDVGAAFQLLRTCIRQGASTLTPSVPGSVEAMLDAIDQEVGDTYPALDLRGIDWDQLLEAHRPDILASEGSLASLQRLFAGLEDAHTWVRDTRLNARAPYRVWVEGDSARLVHVPSWSAAAPAGVSAGDTMIGIEASDWWERTAATPRSRPLVTGYRWLIGTVGETRTLRARTRSGREAAWEERYQPAPWVEPISWHVRSSGTAYLRIRGWGMTPEWIGALDAALDDLASCPRLIVDLRGNIGGQLIAAHHFRSRFLESETTLGSVQFSIGGGALSDHVPITGTPTVGERRWLKPVRFLVDRQTYSASEDAVLGLGRLPHVQIAGEPTGGGSGRPRSIPLDNDLVATISTALTFDRAGRCIEANGIAVDIDLPIDAHFRDPVAMPASVILDLADQGW